MSPGDLATFACSLAVARSCSSIRLVTLTSQGYNSTCSRQLAFLQVRQCPHLSSFSQPQLLSSFADTTGETSNVYPRPKWQYIETLFILEIQSIDDIREISENEAWSRLSRLPCLVWCPFDLFSVVLDKLAWPLDNKVQILVDGGSESYIWEAFRPSPSLPVRRNRLAEATVPMSPSQKLLLASDPWPRRTNLTGFVLRCGTLPYWPFVEIFPTEDGKLHLGGLFGDFLQTLQERLHFRMDCTLPEDGLWGVEKNSDGEHDGLFGDLLKGRIDVAVNTFIFSPERYKIVQFTYPLAQHWAVLVMQKPRLVDASNNFTREFTPDFWATAAAAFCCCVLIRFVFSRYYITKNSPSFSSRVMETIRTFCNMGIGVEESAEIPYRIFALTMLLTVTIIHTCYSSFLITMLSSNLVVLPFQDLDGLYKRRNDYSFGMEADTYHALAIKAAESGLLHDIYRDMVAPNPQYVEPADAGNQRVLSDPRHVFMTVPVTEINCQISVLPKKYFKNPGAMLLRKNFRAKPILDYYMMRMHSSGIIHRLNQKYKQGSTSPIKICQTQAAAPLGVQETYSAFLLLGLGKVISLLILIGEILWKRFFDPSKNRRDTKPETRVTPPTAARLERTSPFEGGL